MSGRSVSSSGSVSADNDSNRTGKSGTSRKPGRTVTSHTVSSTPARPKGRVVVSSSATPEQRERWAPISDATGNARITPEGEEIIESPIPTSKDDIRSVLRDEGNEDVPEFLASDVAAADPTVHDMLTNPRYGGNPGIEVKAKPIRNTPRINAEHAALLRHRIFAVLRTILVIALVVALIWALLYSPLLRYDPGQNNVEGVNQWVDGQAISDIINEPSGQSLLVLKTEKMSQSLGELTGVSDVTVRRNFPHGLTITMTCATPAAVLHVTSDNTLVPVDENGQALALQSEESAYDNIPRIDVATADEARNNEAVGQAVRIMAGFTPSLTARITSTSAPTRDSITSIVDGNLTVLWGDAQDIDLKVLIVEKILEQKDAGNPDYDSITTITVSSPHAPIVK